MIKSTTQRTQYTGKYKTISFDIIKFKRENIKNYVDKYRWAYYIYLFEEQFSPKDWKRLWLRKIQNKDRVHFDYYKSIINEFFWHGECTFYEKNGLNCLHQNIKIGCDYSHYFDEGFMFNEEILLMDVKLTINSVINTFPELLWRCAYDNSFHPELLMIQSPATNDYYFTGNYNDPEKARYITK